MNFSDCKEPQRQRSEELQAGRPQLVTLKREGNTMAPTSSNNNLADSKQDWQQLVETDMISKDLIDVFENVIANLFDQNLSSNPDLLKDCAIICAFLQSNQMFEGLFRTVVHPHIENRVKLLLNQEMSQLSNNTGISGGSASREIGRFMRLFGSLMRDFGFNHIDGNSVVFTGDAGDTFASVVGNKFLFKDCIGPTHGEYSHMIQWLSICLLKQNPARIGGGYKLTNNICDIYSQSLSYKTVNDMPSEFFGNASAPKENKKMTLWDFMVDCFLEGGHHTGLAQDLYTDTYRCPAYVVQSFLTGKLSNTQLGTAWSRKRTNLTDRNPFLLTKNGYLNLNQFANFHRDKQLNKPGQAQAIKSIRTVGKNDNSRTEYTYWNTIGPSQNQAWAGQNRVFPYESRQAQKLTEYYLALSPVSKN